MFIIKLIITRHLNLCYSWYCHFDDDIYVNTAALVRLTQHYDSKKDHYLGNWKRLSEYAYHGKDRISDEVR